MILLKLEEELSELLLLELLLLELLLELLLLELGELLLLLDNVDEEIEASDEGKFKKDVGRPAWMAARSYASAASFAVPKVPMYWYLPPILICALNLFPVLTTPVNPVVLVE